MAVLTDHLCECGCGERTLAISKTSVAQGRVKGEPNRFIYGHARGWDVPVRKPQKPPLTDAERSEQKARWAANKRERYAERREAIRAEQKAYYEANRERINASSRARWASDANLRARQLAQEKARRESDPEFAARKNEVSRRWAAENPERRREQGRRKELTRRGRKRGAHVEVVDPRAVFERSMGMCGICGEAVDIEDFHVDHIVPLARGGSHGYDNVQAAHPTCNLKKGTKCQVW